MKMNFIGEIYFLKLTTELSIREIVNPPLICKNSVSLLSKHKNQKNLLNKHLHTSDNFIRNH
jgi:hypothetical protein